MATEPLTGARIPDLSFSPNIPQDMSNGIRDLADNTVPQFTSTGSRDSAYSAWVSSGYAMRDGLMCVVGTKLYMYVSATSTWVEMGDAAGTTAFSPSWTSNGTSTPTVGNGSLLGVYRKVGRLVWFNIRLTFGSTTNGGFNQYTFGNLPFTSANYEQEVLAKATTNHSSTLRNWSGFAYIAGAGTNLVPFFSNNASPVSWEQTRQTDSGNASGSGIPFISGQFTYLTGANIVMQGTYEATS